jgi:hypothetical protein
MVMKTKARTQVKAKAGAGTGVKNSAKKSVVTAAQAEAVSAAAWRAYRAGTFRLAPKLKLKSPDDAVAFVNERGFVYFWPNKGVDLPSLWSAVAGDRPVADAHDDPGHVTWGWKDKLLSSKRWYYGKLLRGRATMVALDTLPYFYALSENYGDPDDYLLQYQEGRLSQEAKVILEHLLQHGASHTVGIRRETRMTTKDSNTRFDRALGELQVGLKVLPVGVAEVGAWRYSFIYEVLDRHFPELPAAARPIGRGQARAHLLDRYLQSVGAATEAQMVSLFRWKAGEVRSALEQLEAADLARAVSGVAGKPGACWATRRLLPS